jgi:hypothetical protein
MDTEVKKFVERSIKRGDSLDQIKSTLVSYGWEENVNEATGYYDEFKKKSPAGTGLRAAGASPSTRVATPSLSELRVKSTDDTPPYLRAQEAKFESSAEAIRPQLEQIAETQRRQSLSTNIANQILASQKKATDDESFKDAIAPSVKSYWDEYRKTDSTLPESPFDESGNLSSNVARIIDQDIKGFYDRTIKDEKAKLKREAERTNFIDRAGLGIVEAGLGLADLVSKYATPVPFDAIAGMPTMASQKAKEARQKRELSAFAERINAGYTEEEINDGFLGQALKGNFGNSVEMLGLDMLDQVPNLVIAAAAGPAGIAFLGTQAGAQDWVANMDNENMSGLGKVAHAFAIGLTESLTERLFSTDINTVRGIGNSLLKGKFGGAKAFSEIPKKELADALFKRVPKALRGSLEEGIEEGIVSVVSQTMDNVMMGKEFSPMDIAESFVLGASMGGGVQTLAYGVSSLPETRLFSDGYKIKNRVQQINELLKDPSISESEKSLLSNRLNQYKTQLRQLQDESSNLYKQFSPEDQKKMLQIHQDVARQFNGYSQLKTAEAKAEAVSLIKQSLAEKAQIEQKYDSTQKQQVPSPVVQGAQPGGVPVQGTGTETPQAGGVLQVPSQQEEKVVEAAKQPNVGFRPTKAKLTSETLPQVLSGLKSYVESIPEETLQKFETTRQSITDGFESVANVISSFAKEGLNVEVEAINTEDEWNKATMDPTTGKPEKLSRGLYYQRGQEGAPSKIVLFAPALLGNTVYHEGIHEIVPQAFGQEGINKVAKALASGIKRDPGLNAKFGNFLSQYEEGDKSEELLAELGAMVAAGDIDVEITKSLATRFMEAVASVLGAVGIKMAPNSSQLSEAFLSYSQKLGAGAKLDIQKMEESRTRVQGLIGELFSTLGIDLGAPMTPKEADAQRVKRQDLNLPKKGLDAFGQLKKAFGETNAKIIRSKVKSAIEYPDQFIEYVNKNFAVKEQVGQIVDVINADIEADFLLSIGKEKKAFKPEQLKSVEELAEKAGFVFYETETEQDVLSFKSDYDEGEVICTFKDVKGRLGEKYIFWMRRDGFETILPAKEVTREYLESDTIGAKLWREYLATVGIYSINYKGVQPSREDPYGTSSLSVQIDKQDKSVMIINRYNHTVPNPDYTYKGKLDDIIQGLDDAIYSIPKVGGREEALDDDSEEKRSKVVKDLDGRYFFAETIMSSHFISKYGYIEKAVGVFKPIDRSYQRILGAYVLDSKYNNINALFETESIGPVGVWKSLFPYRKIELSKDSVTIKTDYGTLKLGDINDKGVPESIEGDITQIGNDFDGFLVGATRLKKLDLPNLEIVGDEFLGSLTSYFSENRIKTDFDTISFPSLKEAGASFLADAFEKIKSFEFNFPSLEKAGRGFLQNINAKNNVLSFPRLEYFKNDFGKYVRLKRIKHSVDLFIPNLKFADSAYYRELLDLQQLKSIVNDGLFDFLNEKKAALLKEKAFFENVTKVLKENALDIISADRQVTEGILRMIPSWFETTKNNNLSSDSIKSILMTKGGTTVFNSKGEYFDPTEINETIGLATRNPSFFGKFEPNESPSVEVAPSEEAVIDSLSGDAPAGPIGEPQLIRKPPKAQKVIQVKDKYPLSFVNKKNVIDIDKLIDDIIKSDKEVFFWGGDQLGVGDYTDPYTGKVYDLQGGPSYMLVPDNLKRNVVWATGGSAKAFTERIKEKNIDYVFILSGAPIGMTFFNEVVNDIWIDRAAKAFKKIDLFKEAYGEVAKTKALRALSEYPSWDEFRSDLKNSKTKNKVKGIIKEIAEHDTDGAIPFLDKHGLRVVNFDGVRDGYFRENDFSLLDITTVYRVTGAIEGKSNHNTYSNAVIGEAIGIPNRRLSARDIMTEEYLSSKSEKGLLRKELPDSKLMKAIAGDTGTLKSIAKPKAPKRQDFEGKQSAAFVRELDIAITPATTERKFDKVTARIKSLSEKYDRLVKESEKGIDNSEEINNVASQILDAARKQLAARISKVKGASIKFDDDFRGLYNNVFEPSFNVKLRLTPQSNENEVSQILNEFAERYTQDAFIVETASEASEDFRKQLGENVMPLGDYDEKTNMSHFPQLYAEFTSPLSDKELNELSLSLREGGIDGFSLNKKELKITIFPFLTEEQEKLSEDEQRRIKKEYYDKQISSARKAMANVSRVGRDVKSEVRFRKSTYKGAKSTEGATRQYDRDNFLKAHKDGLTKYELLAKEFNKLRLEEIELSKKKEKLPKDKQKRYDEIRSVIQPIIQDTIALNEPFYKEAKREVERIASSVSRKLRGAFVSRFNIKRPERASIKVMRWYNSDIEDLGDGARVNIIVDNEQQADKLFNEINNRYPSKNTDRERRVNETTDLGYPKRLIEMDTKNGFIGEMQIMTPEGYLAKDGVDYFDDNQQDFARKRLKEVQNRLGWAIPDGIGHYFYEINRDENINDELRERAKALSLSYYKAFTNPSFKLSENEFTKELAKFKEDVDKADKSTWDEGNSGKSPQTLNTYLEESEKKGPKRQDISKAQGTLIPVVYNSLLQQSTRNADGTNTPPYTLQEWLTMMTPYLNAQTATAIYNGVARNKPPFTAPSIQDAYDSSKKRMEAGKNKAFFTWNNLKKYFIDRQAELKKAILASGMKNAYNYLVNKAGSGARAAYFYYEKEKDIYKDLKKEQIEKLDQIIMLRRIIEIDSNFDERGEARPKHTNGFNKGYAEMELSRLQSELGDAAYNDLNNRATKYFDAFRSLLDSMYEEGLVSEELYEQLRDIDYQPRLFLDHVFEMDEPSMREMNLSAAQIKRIKEGSEGDIMFDSRFLLALYAKSAFSKIARNKANKEIAKATEAQGNESWVSKTDKPGFSEVTYFEDGVKKSFYLKDNLKSELDDISRVSGMPQNIQKLIGMVTGSFAVKLLATRANPLFVAKNVPRDYLHVLFFTKAYDNMSLPLAAMRLAGDFIKGVKSKLQDDQDFKDFVEFGGGMDFLSTEGMESMITNRTVTNKIIEKLGKAGELSEIGFRLAMYKKFKEDGIKTLGPNATEDEVTRVKVQAVTQAREMIDFSQGGIATKNLEIVSPYINSAFQGFRVSTSYIQNNPKEFAKKLGYLSIGVMMLALYNAMLGDDDMEDIPEETKRKYFIIMTPFTFEEDGKTKRHYVKIAKTQQLAPFIAGLELTSDYFVAEVMGRKPRESKDAYEYAWKGATMYFPKDPSNIKKEISSSVPLFAAIAAYDMNYDTYRERAVSMDYNQVLPQDEDFTNKQVPYFYKALAQGIGASGGEAGPKRLQVATEKFVTTPYSSLLTMGAYTILDSFSRLFELKGPGGIPVKDQAAISNSVSKSLGLSASKVFTGATEPDWRSYTRKEEIDRINMEEKSERRGIKIAAQDIGQKYFEASNAKDSKALTEARKEYQDELMRIKKESGVPDAKYFMDAFQQARKYGKATNPEYNDISYAASNEAKARIIMEYGGRTMSRKELVEYINDYKRKTGKPINGSEILREYQKETGYGK